MKLKYIYMVCALALSASVFADGGRPADDSTTVARPLLVDHMQNAVVHQSDEVRMLLDSRVYGNNTQLVEIDGYRLQIFSSNRQQQAKLEAEQLKQKLEKEIEIPIYILSDQPFWKVRVGNFTTISEASAFKEEFIKQFPTLQSGTYVVRDKIQVKK